MIADRMMAQHTTQCAPSFMSIFIVDYVKLNPEVKAMYDKMEMPKRFAIGMYEDAMRCEHKFRYKKEYTTLLPQADLCSEAPLPAGCSASWPY